MKEKKGSSKMNYIVWKVTKKDFKEVARFANKLIAEMFIEFLGTDDLEVTKVGETPIW